MYNSYVQNGITCIHITLVRCWHLDRTRYQNLSAISCIMLYSSGGKKCTWTRLKRLPCHNRGVAQERRGSQLFSSCLKGGRQPSCI